MAAYIMVKKTETMQAKAKGGIEIYIQVDPLDTWASWPL
jgi:hypothetical protein